MAKRTKGGADVVPINGKGKSGSGEQPVFQQELEVALDQDEMLKLGESLAEARLKTESLQAERADVVGKFNAKIKEQEALISKHAKNLDKGTEPRLVDVQWQEDRAHQIKRLVRLDTKEVVEERAMTADELQEDLFDN